MTTTTKCIYGHINVTITSVNGIAKSVSIQGSADNEYVIVNYDVNDKQDRLAKLVLFKKDSITDFDVASVADIDFSKPNAIEDHNPRFAERIRIGALASKYNEYHERTCYHYKITAPKGSVFAHIDKNIGDGTLLYRRDVSVDKTGKGNYAMKSYYTPVFDKTIEFYSADNKDDRSIILFIADNYRIISVDSNELLKRDCVLTV